MGPQNHLHRADHGDCGVEAAVDEGTAVSLSRSVFADNECHAAMGVPMIGAVLGVIFKNEECCVVVEPMLA